MQAFSASSALAGCTALRNMLSHAETQQLQVLRKDLQALQASGVVFPVDSWPAKLLRPEPRCRPPRVGGCSCRYSEPVCFAQSNYTGKKMNTRVRVTCG